MIDLWPSDIAAQGKAIAPVTILRRQAALLGQKTGNLVEAEVRATGPEALGGDEFNFSFSFVAPTLNDYRYRLFTISHSHEIYPVKIFLNSGKRAEDRILMSAPVKHFLNGEPFQEVECESESRFLDVLRAIFDAPKTRQIIRALLALLAGAPEDESL
jgi:hypothetical protein